MNKSQNAALVAAAVALRALLAGQKHGRGRETETSADGDKWTYDGEFESPPGRSPGLVLESARA